ETIISQHHSEQHPALIEPLQQIAQSSYYLTRYHLGVLRFFNGASDSFQQQLTEQVFQQGLKAHRQVVRILRTSQAAAETLAQAQIDLGDYLQRLQLPQASQKVYRRAWQTLQSGDRTTRQSNWLGQPMPLFPDNHNNVSEASSLARIKAHVDTKGKVERIEVLETYPADSSHVVSAAQAAARRLPFRVAVVDGEVVPGTVEFNLPLALSPVATP
ncbi:MAG: hypothetical protein OIF34_04540, partial [Porticoccaceae bacterium]|nr:hypothetical protein [Porticoccaceae bacterium]